MGTSNGGVMTDLPSSAGGRSQHQHARQSSRRPPRACTARTPSRLAPVAPSVERTPTRKQDGRPHSSRSNPDPPFTPMVLNSPPPPDQKDRWLLRSKWELASIIHFLNVFRPVLNIKVEFSIEELESALLTPNPLLDVIHIALLKAIPPISRNPLNSETWVSVLCKKMKDRWCWVAEDSFPLAPYHGEENATYKELDPDARVVILKALCEARLEQDDIRGFIDEMLKQGTPLSNIRKERTGSDTQGTTYWYENDPVAGQRFYRELRNSDNKEKSKVRGRFMPPPSPPQWETLATDLDDFLLVADKLCSSRNRMEIAIGKRINNDIIPDLRELQKKKERALKKQQRQALLLDSYLSTDNIIAGRSRRDRKPVTYTFDDYDKSISEAIKITKRRNTSPELPAAGERKMSNGDTRQPTEEVDANSLEDEEELETASRAKRMEFASGVKHVEAASPSKPYDSAIPSSESESSGAMQFGRGRRLRKPQRYTESDFVDPTSDNEAGTSNEEDIEGEAVYDDDYVSKRRRLSGSSDGDDEYRGDEDEGEDEDEDDVDEDEEEDDDDYFGSSEEEENGWKGRNSKKTARVGRTREKSKVAERLQAGLRRSQRVNRSNIDYSKYEESDDGDEDMKDSHSQERADSDEEEATLANGGEMNALEPRYASSGHHWDKTDPIDEGYDMKGVDQGNVHHRAGKGVYDLEDVGGGSYRPTNGVNYDEPTVDVKPEVKVHRFLDLNVAAPTVGGVDDGCGKGYNHSLPFMVEKFENSGDDGSTCGSPKMSLEWPKQ